MKRITTEERIQTAKSNLHKLDGEIKHHAARLSKLRLQRRALRAQVVRSVVKLTEEGPHHESL